MKKTIISTLLLAVCLFVQAQVAAVLSPTGETKVYNDLQKAIDGSEANSVIYLTGSFPGCSINKKLTIIGAGYRDDINPATEATKISGNIILLTGSDGTEINGVHCEDIVLGESTSDPSKYIINNIKVKQCNIDGIFQKNHNTSYGGSGLIVNQCIVRGFTILYNYGSVITNNIFLKGGDSYSNYTIKGGKNTLISNNVFLGWTRYTLISQTNTVFTNNICARELAYDNTIYNIFSNNIVIKDPNGNNQLPPAINNFILEGNTTVFEKWNGLFNYECDLHLINDCIGKNAGTDGKDIGIYGGTGWVDGGIPFNPHFKSANIAPASLPDGTLNLKLNVTLNK